MLRTRAGYCGGDKEQPTYRSIGDHTEAISIDFDPLLVSYQDLLVEFWAGHNCQSFNRRRQYMKAIFYRNEKQQELALASLEGEAIRLDESPSILTTEVIPVKDFTYAEGYHQKYGLSRRSESRLFLEEKYTTSKELADSTVATRLNAYLGAGKGKDWAAFAQELPEYGLPEPLAARLREETKKHL